MNYQQPERFAFFEQFTQEQMRRQYAANAAQLKATADRAKRTGTKIGGQTADEWQADADKYEWLSKNYVK